jgi:hypothetical protein
MTKRVVIPKENFAEMNVFTEKYNVRYRIITEDRNRASYWSPIFEVDPEVVFIPSYVNTSLVPPAAPHEQDQLLLEKSGTFTVTIWNPVSVKKNVGGTPTDFPSGPSELPHYDFWVRWGNDRGEGEWLYKERVASTSLNLIKPASANYLSVEIYRPGTPLRRKRMSDTWQSNAWISTASNVITFPSPHLFNTGDPITYNSSSPVGGLSNGGQYWARVISATTITLHSTKEGAVGNTGIMNITSNQNAVGFFTLTGCTVCNFLMYGKYNFSQL